MEDTPEFVYDRHEEAIFVEHSGGRTMLYPNASRREFEVITDVRGLLSRTTSLSDTLIDTLTQQGELIRKSRYFATLNALQQNAGEYYDECLRYQSIVRESESEIVQAQISLLYKAEKFLKHYFRELSIAQSLGFSERLSLTYLTERDYVFLYGFVRNACSTLEYLGKLLESRRGEGKLGLDNKGVTFKRVYRELEEQGLFETFADSQEVRIPFRNEPMQMGELVLDERELQFLWSKRNEIVHHCPVVIENETKETLPEDLLSTSVITLSDAEKLTELASRVHVHSLGIFLKYSASYMQDMIEQLVDALYFGKRADSE